MTEADLRERVLEHLHRRGIGAARAEAIWDVLVEEDYVHEVLTDTASAEYLLAKADAEVKRSNRTRGYRDRPGRRRLEEEVAARLGPDIKEQYETISDVAAMRAGRLPVVLGWHQRLGHRLRDDDVTALLSSPAARMVSAQELNARGVPLVGHLSHIVRYEASYAASQQLPAAGHERHRAQLHIDPGGLEVKVEHHGTVLRHDALGGAVASVALAADVLWPGSLVDELNLAAWEVVAAVPAWHPRDARRFLLTGQFPFISPLQLNVPRSHRWERRGDAVIRLPPILDRRRIELDLDLRLPDARHHEVYRWLQREGLDGDNRQPSSRMLALLRFVEERVDVHGRRPPWPDLRDAWNLTHPQDRYQRYPKMQRDYAGAERLLGFASTARPRSAAGRRGPHAGAQ
jgi:hypothetical protein